MTISGRLLAMLGMFFLLAGCVDRPMEQALAPATPVSLLIQRLDDPTQPNIVYSSRKIYQRGPDRLEGGDIPPDRIGWTLLGLQDRLTGQRRFRVTASMTYDNEESAGYREYDRAQVMPDGPPLAVQPFSRNRGNCAGGNQQPFCITHETVFIWLSEENLQSAGPEGLGLQLAGISGRGWEFTVPQDLIAALFGRMAATVQPAAPVSSS
ncbi:MAG: hypothetical protein AAFY02_17715 [Pseudomonadota bacterium]